MKKISLLILIIAFIPCAKGFAPICKNYIAINLFAISKPLKTFRNSLIIYRELIGKKLTWKEKIILKFLFLKETLFKKPKSSTSKFHYGTISLLCGIAAGVIILISVWSVFPYLFAATAIVFGIIGLRKNKKDTASLIGLILGSTFYLLVLLGVIFLNQIK